MDLDPEGLARWDRAAARWVGLALAVFGFVGSLYFFIEIEVFTQYTLVYHFLAWSARSPVGTGGTATWPFSGCLASSPTYGYPGNRCLFPNYDEALIVFGFVMAAGLVLWYFAGESEAELTALVRVRRAMVRTLHLMSIYVAALLAWSFIVFGALPTWDQSVLWAESAQAGYAAGTWKIFTNTCLIEDPHSTFVWPSCYFPNFYEGLFVASLVAILTYTLKVRYREGERVELD